MDGAGAAVGRARFWLAWAFWSGAACAGPPQQQTPPHVVPPVAVLRVAAQEGTEPK